MRSTLPLLLPALLVACGARTDAPFAEFATVESPPTTMASDTPFASPRRLDAPADPVVASADGARSVEVGLLEPAGGARSVDVGPMEPTDDMDRVPSDPAAFQAEVERNAGLLQRCWESRVDALPVREGVVEIHAHIRPDGLVEGQCIGADTVGDEVVQRCVNDLLAMGRYPASDGVVDVAFQFRLMSPTR
jgi:hypothetical protein